MSKEYYVKYWGQAADVLKEKLQVSELNFWFNNEQHRKNHIKKCLDLCGNIGTIVYSTHEGDDMRYMTVVEMKMVYKGKSYPYTDNFGYGYPCSSAEYMYLEGNYSCDCNLSNFLSEKYEDFPQLPCGDEIEVKDFKIIKVKGDN